MQDMNYSENSSTPSKPPIRWGLVGLTCMSLVLQEFVIPGRTEEGTMRAINNSGRSWIAHIQLPDGSYLKNDTLTFTPEEEAELRRMVPMFRDILKEALSKFVDSQKKYIDQH